MTPFASLLQARHPTVRFEIYLFWSTVSVFPITYAGFAYSAVALRILFGLEMCADFRPPYQVGPGGSGVEQVLIGGGKRLRILLSPGPDQDNASAQVIHKQLNETRQWRAFR